MAHHSKPKVVNNAELKYIARCIEDGYKFFYVCWHGATIVFLAQNSTQAFGMFELLIKYKPSCSPECSDDCAGITRITCNTPPQFIMFAGRRAGTAQVKLISA